MDLFVTNNFDISYLSKLNYLRLRNLSSVNKQYLPICDDNTILRSLICNRNSKILIPPNFNIAEILMNFYNQIVKLFSDNFNMKGLPDYIIPNKFRYTHIINLVRHFIDQLSVDLDGNVNCKNGKSEFSEFIKLNRFLLGVPFSSNYAQSTYDDAIPRDWDDMPNEVILSKTIIEYIRPSIENLIIFDVEFYRIDYHEILKILSDLFLIDEL